MLRKFFITLACAGLLSAKIYSYYDYDEHFWMGAEYLYWKIQESPKVIPLVVSAVPAPDGAPLLGETGTVVLLGDKNIESPWSSGGRFTFGLWCDCYQRVGVELEYFFLGKSKTKSSVFSDGLLDSKFLAVPYFDTTTGVESSIALARPGLFSGSAILQETQCLQGAELNSVTHLCFCSEFNMNVFGGLRYLNFTEKLTFSTSSPFIDPALNNIYRTKDVFKMDNNFYGAQIGMDLNYDIAGFFFEITGKLAFGALSQTGHVHGEFVLNDFTNFARVEHFKGGYFALISNSRNRTRTRFAVVPEVNVNLAYQLLDSLTMQVGYDFLYISNILRASNQLNRKINPTQSALYEYTPTPKLTGTPRPKSAYKSSSFWAQGLNVGVEYRF